MSTEEIIKEAERLTLEERAHVVDSLLRSLNPPDPLLDEQWASLARERLADYRAGKIDPIPGEEVLRKMHERLTPE